jgi:hypothetical protein
MFPKPNDILGNAVDLQIKSNQKATLKLTLWTPNMMAIRMGTTSNEFSMFHLDEGSCYYAVGSEYSISSPFRGNETTGKH